MWDFINGISRFFTLSFTMIALSASCLLAMNRGASFSKEEKDALMDTLFIASCYLKIQSSNSELSSDEILQLKKVRGEYSAPAVETPAQAPVQTPAQTPAQAPVQTPAQTPAQAPAQIPAQAPAQTPAVEAPAQTPAQTQAYRCTIINEAKCRARKTGAHIPNTSPKVYYEEQCKNKPEGDSTLCKKCAEYMDWYINSDQFKESSVRAKKRRYWLGILNEEIPEHVAIVGSKWFEKKFPKGLPSLPSLPSESHTESISQSEPELHIEESVAVESIPTQTEQWKLHMHNGQAYVINTQNNKVYKADPKKNGKDMVLLDQYCGKFENGQINPYIEEDDE